MLKGKRLTAIMFMALLMSLCAPQALAGYMPSGITGPTETPGINGQVDMPPAVNGDISSPGATGDTQFPGATGDMQFPRATGDTQFPGSYGWIGTGLYAAIASLFG